MSHSQIINQQSILRIETLLPESKKNHRRSVMDILREIRVKGIFNNPEEANQHLQKERSEWEL